MKLSTRGRYGLRAMFDLAMNASGEPIPIGEIANRQNISESYLEQLFVNLRREGLINSVRGAHGGYLLGSSPDMIYIGQILRALEGNIAPAECVNEDNTSGCLEADACVTRIIWEKIRDSINEVIDSMTLEDMVNQQKQIDQRMEKTQTGSNISTKCSC